VCARACVCVCRSNGSRGMGRLKVVESQRQMQQRKRRCKQASRQASWEGIGNFLRDIDREGGLLTRSSSATGAGSSL
jgi:hypothetical protein